MNTDIKNYFDYVNAPWGQLFYKLVWRDLQDVCQKKVLDFGSGFGITADFLAAENYVTAIEPNREMLKYSYRKNEYVQIIGDTQKLCEIPSDTFDVVICHNVLEYVENRSELIKELCRVLKIGGVLSVVKHNRAGKIMHKAVFECDADGALSLINGNMALSANFGTVTEYDSSELEKNSDACLVTEKIHGVRMFYALQPNEVKNSTEWAEKMYRLESAASDIQEFQDIAFFHHVILKKVR